jgi:type VI protein secretion system component Hcp
MCCDGQTISKVEVHHCRQIKGKPIPYMMFEMKDAIIANIGTSGNGDELPTEEVGLAYADMQWTFVPTDMKAGVGAGMRAGFDFVKCKAH